MDSHVIQNIKKILSISSESHNYEGVNKVAETIKQIYSDLPLEWQTSQLDNKPAFLVAKSKKWDTSKPVIVLSGHIDVVYPASEVKMKEENGKLYGSGAQDMKSAVVVMLETAKKLCEQNAFQNIFLMLSPQEELGTPDYRFIIEEIAKQADYVMVFESTLDSEPNAPLNKRSVVASRRGFRQFNVLFQSAGGHSGVLMEKEQRNCSNLLAAEFIVELEKLADYNKNTTLNSGIIKGGISVNSLSPRCEVQFDTRFSSIEEMLRVKSDVHKLFTKFSKKIGFKLSITEMGFYPPLVTTEESTKFAEVVISKGQKLGLEVKKEYRGGGSEASLFSYYNPALRVLDGFGPRGDGQHTTQEFVYVESIFSSINLAVEVIKELQIVL